jgi:uncharacterized protein YdhG (YjbR/CyaY superfamily)
MKSSAKTAAEYIKELPEDRRVAIQAVRKVIKANLPAGYEETMQYGMISYVVPLKTYPMGYLNDKKTPLPYASLASQKNHMAIYLFCIYTDTKLLNWFKREYKASGKKMDMGKSCIRFKKLENLPLDLIGKAIAKVPVKAFIKSYETSRHNRK